MQDLYADWAEVYDYFHPDRGIEVAFWARRARRHGWRVLDLMCGTAEVSLGLARQGLSVLGVDRSLAMLTVGSRRLAAAADFPARNLTLAQGDACDLPVSDNHFDFAWVGGNGSFNHLGDEQAGPALCELGRVLRPGGGLGLELVNPHLLSEIEPQRIFGPLRHPSAGTRLKRCVQTRYDPAAGMIHIDQKTFHLDEDGCSEFEESLCLYVQKPEDIATKLRAAGFCNLAFYGGYDLEPFGKWSPDLLVLATRQEAK